MKGIKYIITDGKNQDFICLCHKLDESLNELVGGEENRAAHIPYNKLDDIHHVIVAYCTDEPIGCASFKQYEDGVAEVKRVFVKKEYRGYGISKEMLRRLEDIALQCGYKKFILETGRVFEVAVKLYRNIGFEVIPNFGQYVNMPESVCMKKKLIKPL